MVHLAAILLVSGIVASARQLADLVPRGFEERAVVSSGGWPLYSLACTNATATACGGATLYGCCPKSFSCVAATAKIGWVCCPSGADCSAPLSSTPVCADNTWNLWNATNQGNGRGYFCCLQTQVGTQTGTCVFPDGVPASLSAQLVLPGSATVAASSSQKTSSVAVVTTGTVSTLPLTTANSVSSISSSATMTSASAISASGSSTSATPASGTSASASSSTAKSDAGHVKPMGFSIVGGIVVAEFILALMG